MQDEASGDSSLVRNEKWILAAIFGVQIVIALIYVFRVPLWLPSDERAHTDYVLSLVRIHQLHPYTLHDGQYEAYQPPLFYMTCAGLFSGLQAVFGPRLAVGYTLRLICAVSGVVLSSSVWALIRNRLNDRRLALAALATFAWSPIILAITSSFTNDGGLFLWSALTLLVYARFSFQIASIRQALVLGVMLGCGMLIKTTFVPLVAALLIAECLRGQLSRSLRLSIVTLAVMSLVLAPWLTWNWQHYHAFTGVQRHLSESHSDGPTGMSFSAIRSTIAYHFIPSEFWFNQITVRWIVKLGCTIMFTIGLVAAAVAFVKAIRQRDAARVYSFSALYYIVCVGTWMFFAVFLILLPVRDFFGSYFAFSIFLNMGIADRRFLVARLKAWRYAVAPAFMLLLNIWLITCEMHNLRNLWFCPKLL